MRPALPVLLGAVLLAGCVATSGEAPAPAALLHGAWVVEAIEGASPGKARATLNFQPDGRLAGVAFCNHYTARYAVNGEGLRVGPAAATRKACPPPLMTLESTFLEILQSARSHAVRPDGTLVITGAGGRGIIARKE
jgi:heat shock protein HslJ